MRRFLNTIYAWAAEKMEDPAKWDQQLRQPFTGQTLSDEQERELARIELEQFAAAAGGLPPQS